MKTKNIYIGSIKCVIGVHYLSSNDKIFLFSDEETKVIVQVKKDKYYNIHTKQCYKTDKDLSLSKGEYILDTKSLVSVESFYKIVNANTNSEMFSKQKILMMFNSIPKKDR